MKKIISVLLTATILIGACGISAFPMSARVITKMGMEEDTSNVLLMPSLGVNVSGQIASVIAGGLIGALFFVALVSFLQVFDDRGIIVHNVIVILLVLVCGVGKIGDCKSNYENIQHEKTAVPSLFRLVAAELQYSLVNALI